MSPSDCLNINLLNGIRTQTLASVMIAVLSGMPENVMIEFILYIYIHIYSHPDVIARVDSNCTRRADGNSNK